MLGGISSEVPKMDLIVSTNEFGEDWAKNLSVKFERMIQSRKQKKQSKLSSSGDGPPAPPTYRHNHLISLLHNLQV